MPTFQTRTVFWLFRVTGLFKKQFKGGPTFKRYIDASRSSTSTPSPKLARNLDISLSHFQGRDVWTIAPRDRRASATVLYWHGGGYVYPAASLHWSFFAHMAKVYGWRVVAPLYPLAPEHNAQEISNFALDFYRNLLRSHDGTPLAIAGDSAGGGLTATTLMRARDEGCVLPDRVILICPWLDIAATDPDQVTIEERDPILSIRGLREAGLMFAKGTDIDHPMASPLMGDWQGLPPILAFGGGDDILVTDSRRLKTKLPELRYEEAEDMIHVWPIFGLPESRIAQRTMAEFTT